MGWFNLLTKRLIIPSCHEIEAKIASTWLHFRCWILEVQVISLLNLYLTFFLWIHKASPLFLRSKRKLQVMSFLLGPKAFADNDLFAVECTQTDRMTLKNWNASCIVNYSRTSHTLIIQPLSFPTTYLPVVSDGKWSVASKAWHFK